MLNSSKPPVNSAVNDGQIAGQDNKHVNTKDIIGLSDKSHATCDPVNADVKTQVYKTINDNAICKSHRDTLKTDRKSGRKRKNVEKYQASFK